VDRALLKQAVLNLVLNAAEAMPIGGQLRLGAEPPRRMAEISVGDTGKGIAPETARKFFNYFSPRVREAAESGLRVRFELCSFTMVR